MAVRTLIHLSTCTTPPSSLLDNTGLANKYISLPDHFKRTSIAGSGQGDVGDGLVGRHAHNVHGYLAHRRWLWTSRSRGCAEIEGLVRELHFTTLFRNTIDIRDLSSTSFGYTHHNPQ